MVLLMIIKSPNLKYVRIHLTKRKKEEDVLLYCHCGCGLFYVFNRKKTTEEELAELESSTRLKNDHPLGWAITKNKKGEIVVVSRFLFFQWHERPLTDYQPSVVSYPYVSVKCANCGEESTLLDGREKANANYHCPNYGKLEPVVWSKKVFNIECSLYYYDDSDGQKEISRIKISKLSQEGKKTIVYDYED